MNYLKIHIGDMIRQKLKDEERSVEWLAKKIGKDPSNFRKTLRKKSIDSELLGRISEILKCDFSDCYKNNA
jgi:hypothetical protein